MISETQPTVAAPPNKVTIYALSDPKMPCVIRYIGKTVKPVTELKRRLCEHLRDKRCHCHRSMWIKSVESNGRTPIIWPLEICESEKWQSRERYWISFFKPLGRLTNGNDGGCGGHLMNRKKQYKNNRTGKKMSPAGRARYKYLRSLNRKPPSTKLLASWERFRKTMTGGRKSLPPNEVAALIERNKARKGLPISDHHKEQLNRARANHQKPVMCMDDGSVFPSISDAAKSIGITTVMPIIKAINRRGRSGGKRWVRIPKELYSKLAGQCQPK